MTNYIKCLSVPDYVPFVINYQKSEDLETLDGCEEKRIEPIFGKDGWFYNRLTKMCWIKYGGMAWLEKNSKMFLYDLKILNHKILSSKEKQAIKTLINYNRCPKSLKSLFYFDKEYQYLQNISKEKYKIQKRYLKFKKNKSFKKHVT